MGNVITTAPPALTPQINAKLVLMLPGKMHLLVLVKMGILMMAHLLVLNVTLTVKPVRLLPTIV